MLSGDAVKQPGLRKAPLPAHGAFIDVHGLCRLLVGQAGEKFQHHNLRFFRVFRLEFLQRLFHQQDFFVRQRRRQIKIINVQQSLSAAAFEP